MQPGRARGLEHGAEHLSVDGRVTHHPAAPDPVPARFELRFHERDHGAPGGQHPHDRAPDEPEADEREVGGHQIAWAADLIR